MRLPEVDVSRFHMPRIICEVRPDPFDVTRVEIRARAYIRNVETGEEGDIVNRTSIHRLDAEDSKLMTHVVLQTLRSMLLHELDECLYIDGVRLCAEPHPEQKK